MDLQAYLADRKITASAFAREIKVTPQALHRYLNKGRRPSSKVMDLIIAATKGSVTPNDFFSVQEDETTGEAA